jgi:hypothetical protein
LRRFAGPGKGFAPGPGPGLAAGKMCRNEALNIFWFLFVPKGFNTFCTLPRARFRAVKKY